MSQKQVFEYNLAGRSLKVEIGELAKQANGAALIRYGDTAVLTASVASTKASTMDFFPLMVLYQEKLYAAGKIPGGFLKREGRPSDHGTLTARLIDRPIRPLFPEGFKNEVQIVNTVLSVNVDNTPEMAAMFGSSLSLMISDIPFNGPIAGVYVGRINGEFVINPTVEQKEISDIELIVAGTKDAINMVEAGAKEVSEADMLDAIMFGHDEIKRLCEFQLEIVKVINKEKFEYTIEEVTDEINKGVRDLVEKRLKEALVIVEKQARGEAIAALQEEAITKYETEFEDDKNLNDILKQVRATLENIIVEEFRRLITVDKIRPDGRRHDEIRNLDSQIDILDRTHGSALFTRGQTQALSTVTLGALGEYQIIDGLGAETSKRFMLHYNFPQFSVGSTGRYGAPGRREIGHGALGERALYQVLPDEEVFPYTIRVVSEILESNGSSSQASICAGTMALMAAGVPIKAPVAGIAMGLVSQDKDYIILTDIQGMEDHYGDMDFKVAGTKDGITALQMDIKIEGLSKEILKEALEQAKVARMQVLENMMTAITEPRKELSEYAPKVKMLRIKPDQIRDVIGSGGKIISDIIEKCNDVKIDIEQDGRVFIMHQDQIWIDKAVEMIELIVKEAKPGEIYSGKVVRIESFGAFINLWEGTDGLCHISQLAHERTNKVTDICNIGDTLVVKVIGVDEKGRIDLSRKALLPKPEKTEEDTKKKPRKDKK